MPTERVAYVERELGDNFRFRSNMGVQFAMRMAFAAFWVAHPQDIEHAAKRIKRTCPCLAAPHPARLRRAPACSEVVQAFPHRSECLPLGCFLASSVKILRELQAAHGDLNRPEHPASATATLSPLLIARRSASSSSTAVAFVMAATGPRPSPASRRRIEQHPAFPGPCRASQRDRFRLRRD